MRKLILGVICSGALSIVANATPILPGFGSDFPAQDISNITGQPGLGNDNVLSWLQAEAAITGGPAPTTAISDYTGGPIAAGDYLVLHYGVGRDGAQASGGGLVVVYFPTDVSSYAVPQNGQGQNGFGGLSFARLFDHNPPPPPSRNVPEGGSTLAMLGLGVVGCAGLKKRFAR